MNDVRAFLARRRWLAAWLVGSALLVKALAPAGFMPGLSAGNMVIQLCTGQGAQTVVMGVPAKAGDHDRGDHKPAEMPCAFSGLALPGLAAADPILLTIAIIFILAISLRARPTLVLRRAVHPRPPSQGPPATA